MTIETPTDKPKARAQIPTWKIVIALLTVAALAVLVLKQAF